MKKTFNKISWVLLAICALSLCYCGKKETTETTVYKADETKVTETTKKAAEETKAAKPQIKIGIVEKDKKTNYDVVEFGKYDSEAGKTRSIQWLVADKNDSSYLLISRYIVDCKNYNDENKNVNWQDSTLNIWLNNYFLNGSFSSDEISYMNRVKDFGLAGNDKVSLLNVTACKKYFGSEDENKRNYKLSAEATNWAISNGEEVVGNKDSEYNNCGSFFLTDNGKTNDKAAWVGQYGHLYEDGQDVKLNKGDGVRPVIVVKKELIDEDLNIAKVEPKVETAETVESKEDETTESEEETAEKKVDKKSNVYSNKARETYQSTSVPSVEKNVIALSGWEYGKTPIKWIYVMPNTQIICNNSPNRSELFAYKFSASSGSKGCYMPIFSRGESYGQDWDGRLYSFDDYKKTAPEEMKFDNKFEDLKYGDYSVKELLSRKYDIETVADGVVKANGTYVNVIYVSELDEIIGN